MADKVVLDGELSLNIPLDGEAGTVIKVGHDTGIDTIVFNPDYTLTFNMINGKTFTTGSIRGQTGADTTSSYALSFSTLVQVDRNNCRCNMCSIPVTIDVFNNSTIPVTFSVADVVVTPVSR